MSLADRSPTRSPNPASRAARVLCSLSLCCLAVAGCIENDLRGRPGQVDPVSSGATITAPPVPHAEDCASGPVTWSVSLDFPARQDGPFGEADNLDPHNEHTQARVEETQSVGLPPGAVLCGLSLSSQQDAVYFDDHLMITLDDVVLVGGGSGHALDQLEQVDDLPRYRWSALAGTPFSDRYAPYDCLGGVESRCDVPRTEETGPLDVEISDAATAQLARVLSPERMPFSVVTFGDDDAGDCSHAELTLDVVLSYAGAP